MQDTSLWTIRATLTAILYLKDTVKQEMVNKHCRMYVSKEQLTEMDLSQFKDYIHFDD